MSALHYSPQTSLIIKDEADERRVDKLIDGIVLKAAFQANGYSVRNETNINSFDEKNQYNNNSGYQDLLDDITRIGYFVGQFFYTPVNFVNGLNKQFVRRFLSVTNAERVDQTTNAYPNQPTKR